MDWMGWKNEDADIENVQLEDRKIAQPSFVPIKDQASVFDVNRQEVSLGNARLAREKRSAINKNRVASHSLFKLPKKPDRRKRQIVARRRTRSPRTSEK
jgi:hypothetical protein